MHIATIIEATAAALTVLGGIVGVGYAGIVKLERMTAAIEKLADRLGTTGVKVDEHDVKLDDHEVRIVVLETKTK
jgi:hypothetical protein